MFKMHCDTSSIRLPQSGACATTIDWLPDVYYIYNMLYRSFVQVILSKSWVRGLTVDRRQAYAMPNNAQRLYLHKQHASMLCWVNLSGHRTSCIHYIPIVLCTFCIIVPTITVFFSFSKQHHNIAHQPKTKGNNYFTALTACVNAMEINVLCLSIKFFIHKVRTLSVRIYIMQYSMVEWSNAKRMRLLQSMPFDLIINVCQLWMRHGKISIRNFVLFMQWADWLADTNQPIRSVYHVQNTRFATYIDLFRRSFVLVFVTLILAFGLCEGWTRRFIIQSSICERIDVWSVASTSLNHTHNTLSFLFHCRFKW